MVDEEFGDDKVPAEFIRLTTERGVFQVLARAAADRLPADLCKVAVVEGAELVPQARSDTQPVDSDNRIALRGTPAGHTVTTGSPTIIDDIQFTRSAAASDTPNPKNDSPRSVMAVPISTDAVLVGTSPRPGTFTRSDRETAERLVSYAEAALERIHRERAPLQDGDRFSEFGSIVVHDLRGPLAVARGYTGHVQETGDLEQLDPVVQALERMDEMITDLRDLVESGRHIDVQERVSLSGLASQCWNTVDTGRATLSIDGEIEVRADQSQLRHLLENLFRNAVTHGGEDVTVTVGPSADGFYVEDSGPGISPDLGEDIFEAGVTTSENGTGYGLAIVERIVDAHGWVITVVENNSGGARFEVAGVQ